jgi:hypothetical protein
VKLGLAIREVGDAERTLAQQLNALGGRHKTDHDVFHLTETLQRIAHDNLERLAPHGERYGVDIDAADAPAEHGSGLLEKAREKSAELIGRRPEPGLLLVRERTLHLLYARHRSTTSSSAKEPRPATATSSTPSRSAMRSRCAA